MTNTPPGPTGSFGNLAFARRFSRDPITVFNELAQYEADLLYYKLGPFPVYMVKHPDLIHDVLVKKAKSFQKWTRQKQVFGKFDGNGLVNSDGDFWRRQRKLVQPAFHHKRIRAYADVMVEYTQNHIESWRQTDTLDIGKAVSHLTRDIVTKTLFDADVSDETRKIGDAIEVIQVMAFEQFGAMIPAPDWLPTVRKRREREAIAYLDSVIYRFIRERRESGNLQDRGDLLSMLLMAVEDGEGMTDVQARDEAMTLFIAGHETTATALSWVYYLLAAHPEVEAKFLAEVDALEGHTPTFDDLPRLKYTEWIIKEALRLYPPTYFFPREVAEPVEIGGYTLPKGALLHISPYMLHHDPRFWDQPETFMPERFAPEHIESVPDYAYFPFGGGQRVCIGNTFAMMEMQLILATVAQRLRFTLTAGQTQPELLPLITLLPKGGVHVRPTTREHTSVPAL